MPSQHNPHILNQTIPEYTRARLGFPEEVGSRFEKKNTNETSMVQIFSVLNDFHYLVPHGMIGSHTHELSSHLRVTKQGSGMEGSLAILQERDQEKKWKSILSHLHTSMTAH